VRERSFRPSWPEKARVGKRSPALPMWVDRHLDPVFGEFAATSVGVAGGELWLERW
jgi:hypothetical protein